MLVPAVDYGGAVWFGDSNLRKRAQAIQNKAVVAALGINSKTNEWAFRSEFGMLSSEMRRVQLRLSLLGKLAWMEPSRIPKIALLNNWQHVAQAGRRSKTWEKDAEDWIRKLGLSSGFGKLLCDAPDALRIAEKFGHVRDYTDALRTYRPPNIATKAEQQQLEAWNSRVKEHVRSYENKLFMKSCRESSNLARLGRLRSEMGLQPWLEGPLTTAVLLKLKFRLGTHGLGAVQLRINEEVSGICRLCDTNTTESVDHFIADCKYNPFSLLRAKLVKSLTTSKFESDRAQATMLLAAKSALSFSDIILGPPDDVSQPPPTEPLPTRRRSKRNQKRASSPAITPTKWAPSFETSNITEAEVKGKE
jgi:hypothetical protein